MVVWDMGIGDRGIYEEEPYRVRVRLSVERGIWDMGIDGGASGEWGSRDSLGRRPCYP